MSSPPAAASFLNNPLINTITGYIAHLQEQDFFSQERLYSYRHYVLLTVGFLVVLYCLIHIQILFFWLLKLIFRLLFKIISIIFWLPLKAVRFLIPRTIDYDILFPLFWLCSISSFYLSKYSHENICQFYDQQLVRRYKILSYDQTKREDIRRYLFISTFIILLLLQSLCLLVPIALSIRHQHTKVSPPPVVIKQTTTTTTVKTPTAKSAVKDVVETMSENLYNRFIDAFKDENETHINEKRSPLVSDEKLEDTFKTIQKTIQHGMEDLKTKDNQKEVKKSSRFHRWIVYYLKAPFKKWEGKKNVEFRSNIEEKKLEVENNKEEEEEDVESNSSSSISDVVESDDDDDDDEDEDDEDDDDDDSSEDDGEQEEHSTITEKLRQRLNTIKDLGEDLKENIKSKISPPTDNEESDEEDSPSLRERLTKPFETAKDISEEVAKKLSSSTADDSEESEEDEDDEELTSITEKIKEQLAKPIEKVKNITEEIADQLRNKLSSSPTDDEDSDDEIRVDEDEEEEQSSKIAEKIKQTLTKPIETVKNFVSSTDEEEEEDSTPLTEHIKERLAKPLETVKDLGDKVLTSVKDKLSSSTNNADEDSGTESDGDEEHSSVFESIRETVIQPIETAASNLRDKLPSLTKKHEEEEEDLSLIDRAEKILTPIKDKISSNADQLKQQANNLVDSAQEFSSNVREKSSEYLKERTEQIKENLPKMSEVLKPLEAKASKVTKSLKTNSEHLKESVINKMKSLKKGKKIKDKLKSFKEKAKKKASKLFNKLKPKSKKQKKLNGWFDEAWNIWHQTKTSLAHMFSSSTKHARHLPRYNTTSLYTAYTDLKCYDYTKKLNRYRGLKRNYLHFIDSYRHHSPFTVYLSVLKSNGPKCYRQYPDSTCGLVLKSSNRSFKSQLYRFVKFWAIVGILIMILAAIYKRLISRKQTNVTSFYHPKDSDRSSNVKQQIRNDLPTTKTTTIQKPSTINQQTFSSTNNTRPLNEKIEGELRLWLQHEQNDGFRNISETCRTAINNTFIKQLERLSVETLQFANAKIRNVSQNNKTDETPAEKIVIQAVLDIDHLILNIVNTFKEQHFSLETQKLSGQLHVLLIINPNQYSIEANLKQLQINPVNIIDPNNALSTEEKQSIVKLIDETINRTTVRCTFRLSDNQENTSRNAINDSSFISYPDSNKTYSTSNQLSALTVQTSAPRSRQPTPNKYQLTDSPPIVLINDINQHLYTTQPLSDTEPKRLLVRVVKAVKLHDVEQPYCILELNEPKQIHQTRIAKNGLNPFWDERFLFECDDKSNQIHLQIIDRKKTNKKIGSQFVDTVYADVSIPFSYVTSTVYKQDVQISPQFPESIIRIEFSTLSEEEALAANNGYDVESITDSQVWSYNEREASKIEHDYPQRYTQSPSNDFLSSSYDTGTLPKHYGLSTSLYDDGQNYASTLPRPIGLHSTTTQFSPPIPRDGGVGNAKPQKSKSFMSSLKHLTLPRRKHHNKDKHHENSISSQASSVSQLNTSIPSPATNTVTHSLSTALPGPLPEYFVGNITDAKPVRRSRSISQSFKNLFRSNSKKKALAAKADALGEFENGTHNFVVDSRNFQSTSTPTPKKLSFLQRRKSKQKAKQQTNLSTNSLSSYDYSRVESVRDTPIRANVGHPVTMNKALVR